MRQPVPFGKYLLLDRISVGGMAEVFKAKSYGVEGFEKIIAIKRILPTMGEDRDFIKMFIDEAKIAGQLAHANICQIFELGRIDGSHFIAMEYIWGKDLLQIQNRLRKIKQPMPIAMACFTIAKVLEGLDYAHRKRDPLGRPLEIVHRDCSPQNVLVSYEGEVKVIDFGIAKATSRNSRTMAGVLKGKFGYMSPEQVRGLPLDRRSDIFALGTMLYECLTGERLFQGETDFSTLEKVRNVDIRPPRELNPNIPEAVEKVILKALAKDVDERYQWCSEMLADLQQHLMGQDVVFTAKSLSGWLKEVFASEIERERQQLEAYKRVGRDGLIAGAPAAVAKVDLVETLGEAGLPESDATQLGGPNFDDLEDAVAAQPAPDVGGGAGPALGSPAARGPQPQPAPAGGADDEEFGDEAPTEIFGDADAANIAALAKPAPPPRPSAPVQAPPNRATPPRPPTPMGRPATASQQPVAYAAGGGGPMPPTSNPNAATLMAADAQLAHQAGAQAREAYAQSFPHLAHGGPSPGFVPAAHTPGPQPALLAQGTPGAMPVQGHGGQLDAPPGGAQGKTLMGAAPPPGVPSYAQGYPGSNLSGQQPAYPGYASQQLPYGHPHAMAPGQLPNQLPHAMANPMHGHGMSGPMPGYAATPYGAQAELTVPVVPDGKRRSSIARDVGIGVAIAALVLGGFLAVKFLVLDKKADAPATSGSTIATLRLAMPAGVSAELYVDEKKVATVSNGHEIPVNAGVRKVKLLGPDGARCEQDMKLDAGKVTPVECVMNAGSGAATPAGAGGGSAGNAATPEPAAGSASDPAADKAAADKAAADKAAADKAAADKAAADKAAADKAAADKAAADKAAADKAAKAAADKAAADKAARDKARASGTTTPKTTRTTKPDKDDDSDESDNPIDRAAALPSKGYVKIVPPAGATILVDGAPPTGSTSKLALVPGKHKVTFVLGADKHTFTVLIKAGETITLDKKDLQ